MNVWRFFGRFCCPARTPRLAPNRRQRACRSSHFNALAQTTHKRKKTDPRRMIAYPDLRKPAFSCGPLSCAQEYRRWRNRPFADPPIKIAFSRLQGVGFLGSAIWPRYRPFRKSASAAINCNFGESWEKRWPPFRLFPAKQIRAPVKRPKLIQPGANFGFP